VRRGCWKTLLEEAGGRAVGRHCWKTLSEEAVGRAVGRHCWKTLSEEAVGRGLDEDVEKSCLVRMMKDVGESVRGCLKNSSRMKTSRTTI